MLKIGDFSKLSMVSVKALRYYDELGLLKPVKVDEFTGYRYYSADQLSRLNRIIALKDMGLSLEEISRLLNDDVSIGQILELLHIKQGELKQRLKSEAERLQRVEEWLKQTEKEGKMPAYEVVVKKIAPQKVVSIRQVVPTYGHIGILFGKIGPYVGKMRAPIVGPPITLYHDKEFKESEVDVELAFPVATDVPVSGEFQMKELKGYKEVASVVHKGSYENISAAYNALMKWVEKNGYRIIDCNREIYLTDPNSGIPASEYVTEIQFPVAKD